MNLTNFYKNKNIFITGGTGNIGKGIVGKLLESFEDIGTLYLLVRGKEGKSVKERIEECLNDPALVHLKRINSNFNEKMVWLEGDITKTNLGLSEESMQLIITNVNIIFHSAANVNLAVTMKNGIINNIKGTQELLKIAEKCFNLDCFMYISTTYTNTRKTVNYIEEKYYEHPVSPQQLLDLAKLNSVEQLEKETTRMLNNDWILTYCYTKNAAENLCKQYESKFKIGIFRSAIVVESISEPFPYCGKNTSVIETILMMAAKGYVMNFNPAVQMNRVPIDFTINAIIAATQYTSEKKRGTTNIYNYSSNNHPISFAKGIKYYLDGFQDSSNFSKLPNDKINLHINNLKTFFKNSSSQPMWQKFEKLNKLINYARLNPFYFENKNIEEVWNNMSSEDQKKFWFSLKTVDWKLFFRNMYMNKL